MKSENANNPQLMTDLDELYSYSRFDFNRRYATEMLLTKRGFSIDRKKHTISDLEWDAIDNQKGGLVAALDVEACPVRCMATDRNEYLIYSVGGGLVGTISVDSDDCLRNIRVAGGNEAVESVLARLREISTENRTPVATRLVLTPQGIRETKVMMSELETPTDFAKVYPYLDGLTPSELWRQFNESKARVLFLYGEPGTGKSSFITAMLRARGLDKPTYLADDANLLSAPSLVDTLRGFTTGSVIVTEDSDIMVKSRDGGNAAMSGLLNAVSGLAAVDTRFIISTNLPTLKDVDSALLRPGRTFKQLHFLPLTPAQANEARVSFGMAEVDFTKEEVSLAQALNWDDYAIEAANQAESSAFGFRGGK